MNISGLFNIPLRLLLNENSISKASDWAGKGLIFRAEGVGVGARGGGSNQSVITTFSHIATERRTAEY